jgi:predicted dehydrogenase
VGCGLIGKRRAEIVRRCLGDELVIVADVDEPQARSLAGEMGCLATTDWQEVIARDDVEAVVVSTPNKYLMPITVAALEHGKHVLVEKPMARNLGEAEQVLRVARRQGDKGTRRQGDKETEKRSPCLPVLGVGFNHRHHPAIWKAKELLDRGSIGDPLFIRCRYGHGGRLGYDKEWRADADMAGGGELLDQGVHIVDLCRWFLGDFTEAVGFTATFVWNADRGPQTADCRGRQSADGGQRSAVGGRVEDNAFALLCTARGQVASLHASWTQWKNLFSFEVFGQEGHLIVDGLGGSYGIEQLTIGRRILEGGAPKEEVLEFSGPDLSWQAEWQEFTSAIRENRQPLANGEDGLQVMRLIDAIYESARTGTVVRL